MGPWACYPRISSSTDFVLCLPFEYVIVRLCPERPCHTLTLEVSWRDSVKRVKVCALGASRELRGPQEHILAPNELTGRFWVSCQSTQPRALVARRSGCLECLCVVAFVGCQAGVSSRPACSGRTIGFGTRRGLLPSYLLLEMHRPTQRHGTAIFHYSSSWV